MNMTHTLRNTATALTTLNRYHLEIPSCSSPLDVEEFSGSEGMSQIYCYDIMFTSTDRQLDPGQFLRKTASLTMKTGLLSTLQEQKRVHGVITDFRRITSSADQTQYHITLKPFLALLDKQHRSHRFFVNKSVPEVVAQVLSEHRFHDWEFVFNLRKAYPKREQINQYQESDLAFIQRLLAELGIFYFFTLQPDTQTEVINFGDSQSSLYCDKKLTISSPSGMSDNGADSIWALSVVHNVVEASVTTKDYNHRTPGYRLQSAAADMTRGDGDDINYGDVYRYHARHLTQGNELYPDPETANFYARLDHERFLTEQTRITGISTDATLSPAQVLFITDSVPPTLPTPLHSDPLLLIGLLFTASRKEALSVALQGVPYSDIICWRPPLLPRPKVVGTMTARITSARERDIYAWQDAAGLYRVKFDADLDDKNQGRESMPVRLAKPYGGDKYGFHFPLIQGTEVAIAFHEGDPDRPYIAHALHDSYRVDHVTEKNNTRNVIRTAAFNKLRMEDKRGKEHIKLSTVYGGKTQLNLGHNVDTKRTLRGEGAELRTDRHIALRGGAGVFITADKQPAAEGLMLEMQATLERLQQAGEQMQTLSQAAEAAKAAPAQIETQLAFLRDQVEQLKDAVAVLSAPEGVAVTSGKHLQLAARRNLMLNAGEDADIGIVKRLFIGIGQGVNLFVRKLGIRLIASQGDITLQAQQDRMQLMARMGLDITSTEDEIHIVAKKKIILNAGGSYLKIDPDKIEAGTRGNYLVKASHIGSYGPAGMSADHPEYPALAEHVKQPLRIAIPQSPNAPESSWQGMPYSLFADDVLIKKGVLDGSGQLHIDHQIVTQQYKLEMANGVSYQIPIVEAYRHAEQGTLANRGFHHHLSQETDTINTPQSHKDHRHLYASLFGSTNDREKI